MKRSFVSIVVPAYNAQKTISKCITSLLNLDYPKDLYEIIVVDNNSTDRTAELVKAYASVIYASESKQGRSYTRNTGAQLARGDLIAFIDADVFLDKNWLKFLGALFSDSAVGGGQGRVIPSNEDGQVSLNNFRIRQQNESTNNTNIILRLMYAESPMVNSAACLYRKEAFHFAGGFDVLLERHEDIDLAKRICLGGYELTAASEAKAYVEYHGEGWWSYFVRSFSEGFTKQSYNKKWMQYFSAQHSETSGNNSDNRFAFHGLKMNLHMVADEIIFNLIRAGLSFDNYYLLKAVNSTFKAAGRLWGIWKNDYPGKFLPKINKELLNRSLSLEKELTVKLDDNIRFVLQDGEILYAINIQKNEVVSFNSFPSLIKILQHRETKV